MTTSKVTRLTAGALDGSFGPDRSRRVVITFIPGDGDKVKDVLSLRPIRTRRAETIAVLDVYRFALRARVNLEVLDKARARKAAKAERLASQRLARADKRISARARAEVNHQ